MRRVSRLSGPGSTLAAMPIPSVAVPGVRLVGVREAAEHLCRVLDVPDPTPDDVNRWCNMIHVWVYRHKVTQYGRRGEWRYDLLDLWRIAQHWQPRPGARRP